MLEMKNISNIDFKRLGPRKNSKIVIIGGCGGIGRTLVNASLELELKVAVLDLEKSIKEFPPPNSCLTLPIDATNEQEVEQTFKSIKMQWGGCDILINLCGFTNDFHPVSEVNSETWDNIHSGNLRSVFLCSKAAIDLLRTSKNGVIVNTASGLAFKGMKGTSPYGSAKAGVIALSKSLASENAPNIRVNVIAPGAVDTAFLYGGTGRHTKTNKPHINKSQYAQQTPMQRLAIPEDIVGPILFLSGDSARFITGQVIHINGGGYMP